MLPFLNKLDGRWFFFFVVFPFFSLIRDANELDSEWNHGGSESRSDLDCMVPDPDPVPT